MSRRSTVLSLFSRACAGVDPANVRCLICVVEGIVYGVLVRQNKHKMDKAGKKSYGTIYNFNGVMDLQIL
jgi:hypothetical protein